MMENECSRAFDKYWESIQVPADDQKNWSKPDPDLDRASMEMLERLKFDLRKGFRAGWNARGDSHD